MAEFLRNGNVIKIKPAGTDYDLERGKVYNLKADMFGNSFLEEDGNLNLGFKIYNSTEDERFMDRVLNYYNHTNKLTTGVMLAGLKGSGKTVMAKQLAKRSGLPIIVVDSGYNARYLNGFFTQFKAEVCVIFDEFEKNWRSDHLLDFLDGVQETAKKLVLFTCNSMSNTSEFLKDRCSRIRYRRFFNAMDNTRFLKELIADNGIEDKNDELYNFIINHLEILSIDNILSFLEEKKICPELENIDIAADMNLTLKNVEAISKGKKIATGIDSDTTEKTPLGMATSEDMREALRELLEEMEVEYMN